MPGVIDPLKDSEIASCFTAAGWIWSRRLHTNLRRAQNSFDIPRQHMDYIGAQNLMIYLSNYETTNKILEIIYTKDI